MDTEVTMVANFARLQTTARACVVVLLLNACSSNADTTSPADPDPIAQLPSCGTRTEFFSASPIALADFYGWVPLGNLNPPSHTFPAPHQYLYHTLAGGALHTVPVVSPGDITMTRVSRRTFTADGRVDYSMEFAVCRDVAGSFNHLSGLEASISSKLPPFDQQCFSSTAPPAYTDCTTKPISIPIATGARIGVTGGVPGLLAWDFGLRDFRVPAIQYANPARWAARSGPSGDLLHVVAASDYFVEPVRSQIAARLGRGDNTEKRTVPPLGGTIDVDVPGTAQGLWFNVARLSGSEGPHLAIAPDNVDPTRFAVSGSESLPGYAATVGYWRPVATGLTNPAPRSIVTDGQIRCLNLLNGRSMLLLLVDATTLRAEARPAGVNCAAQQPWAFGASAFEFRR